MDAERYCTTCGGCYGTELESAPEDHVCPQGDEDPQWCGVCGAELTEHGSCDNDHDEEEDEDGGE